MTADKPSPFVPKLRFPEFAQGPGWDHATVADLVETVTPPKKLTTSTYLADGRFPIIDQSQSYICGWTNDDEAVITRPLPVIVFGDHTCVLKFVNRPFAQGADGVKILTARRRVSTLYLYHQLTYRPVVMEEYKRHFSALKDKVVCFPDPKSGEQQKIAGCLGSLDDLIATEGRKLEALRQHKQGLIQQLLPQPGETVPRLRFPEFEDAPEWESHELGLMTSKIGSGVTPRGGEKNYRSSGRPFVRSQNVGWGELILDNVVHIDEDTHAYFAATEVKEGDVLLNISGASIGRSAIADARIAGGNVNQHVCIIRGLSEQIQAWFLSQYLISKHGQDQIDRCQAGGNRQGLNFGQIRSFLIPQPRDVAEQERIADCLRAADIILATQAQRISALKRQNQGLLQQLFPSLEG